MVRLITCTLESSKNGFASTCAHAVPPVTAKAAARMPMIRLPEPTPAHLPIGKLEHPGTSPSNCRSALDLCQHILLIGGEKLEERCVGIGADGGLLARQVPQRRRQLTDSGAVVVPDGGGETLPRELHVAAYPGLRVHRPGEDDLGLLILRGSEPQ